MTAKQEAHGDWVVLLHGLARTRRSMRPIRRCLERQGFRVVNIGYPSRRETPDTLVEKIIAPAIASVVDRTEGPIHFVGHSLGCLLIRLWLEGAPERVGRVVMLGPPNQGSELADRLRGWPPFRWLNGPAGQLLGTGPAGLPARLGKIKVPCGVIAGNRSLNPIFSRIISGPSDGKVSVARTRLDGMTDWVELPVSHTWMMGQSSVQREVVHFLVQGRFSRGMQKSGKPELAAG